MIVDLNESQRRSPAVHCPDHFIIWKDAYGILHCAGCQLPPAPGTPARSLVKKFAVAIVLPNGGKGWEEFEPMFI